MFAKASTHAAIAALMVMVLTGGARAEGALAFAKNGASTGYSYGFATKADAQRAALSACGGGCSIVADFTKTCAAFAADKATPNIAAAAFNSTPPAARQSAIIACAKKGGTTCQIRVWACDR